MRIQEKLLPLFTAAFLMGVGTYSQAQDYGRLITDLMRNRTPNSKDISGVINSISKVSYGQIPKGVSAPQDAAGKVVIYSTQWCGFCKKAISHMQQNDIPFVERDVEQDSTYRAELAQLGGKGVPFLVFGQKTMQGASTTEIDKHYAEFQRALAAKPAMGAPAGISALASGDALVGKIPGVKVYEQPNKAAPRVTQLTKTEEVIYLGEERDGLYLVATSKGEGWADKLLLKKP